MRGQWPFAVLSVLLGISVGGNVWLLRSRRSQPDRPQPLAEGTRLPPLEATALAGGGNTTVGFDGSRPTALYVFSPQCSWCTRNLEAIRALARERGAEYRFLGLSLSELDLGPYVERTALPFPVYSRVSHSTRAAYRLRATPALIVVSPDGRVLKNWTGAFRGAVGKNIEQYFRLSLPQTP